MTRKPGVPFTAEAGEDLTAGIVELRDDLKAYQRARDSALPPAGALLLDARAGNVVLIYPSAYVTGFTPDRDDIYFKPLVEG